MSSLQLTPNSIGLLAISLISAFPTCCLAQIQAGVFDFGQSMEGQKRGNWTPGEWMAVILLIMIVCLGLAIALGFCYYVKKRQTRRTFAMQDAQPRQVRQRNQLGEFVLVPHNDSSARSHKQYSQNGSLIAQI